MIMALAVSAFAANCLLDGAVCAIILFTTGKKPSKGFLK